MTYQSLITGLITLGNLNCRQVQVYIFALICELELGLTEFIEDNLNDEQLEKFMTDKSDKLIEDNLSDEQLEKLMNSISDKLKIWENYQKLVESGLENKLLEHLYFTHFFKIIKYFNLNEKLGYSKSQWKELTRINDLRNLVAHPTRSLVDKKNDVNQLWRRIGQIEDLSSRLNQLKRTPVVTTAL